MGKTNMIITKPEMIIFDYGDTLLCEHDWNSDISDLHLDKTFNIEEYYEMLEKMTDIIAYESKNEDNICIVCCGDIVNKGNSKEYNDAAISVFEFFKNKLNSKPVDFICVPGNS